MEDFGVPCKYWDIYASSTCIYWNFEDTTCTFVDYTQGNLPSFYPRCNLIGNEFRCTKYKPRLNKVEPCCILPSLYQLDAIRDCCRVTISDTTIDYSIISSYNKDHCVFHNPDTDAISDGTSLNCSCYTPSILGFTTYSGVCDHLPINYALLNNRVSFGRCYWWRNEDYFYKLDKNQLTDCGFYTIIFPEFKCTHSDSEYTQKFKTLNIDTSEEEDFIIYPCNGAKAECKYYNGYVVCANNDFTALSDIKLQSGEKVNAYSIFEVRYNSLRNRWTSDFFYTYFINPEIFTFGGDRPDVIYLNNEIVDFKIDSFRVYISNFDTFKLENESTLLTKGNASDGIVADYPTLITELEESPCLPIIYSTFYNKTSSSQEFDYIFEVSREKDKYIKLLGDNPKINTKVVAINLSLLDIGYPAELVDYSSLFFLKKDLPDTEEARLYYDNVFNKLQKFLFLLTFFYSDKVFNNLNKDIWASYFDIDVETRFGENIIVVISYNDTYFEYDSIKITKLFCGALLAQTSFTCYNSHNQYSYLPYFDLRFHLKTLSVKAEVNFLSVCGDGLQAQPIGWYLDTCYHNEKPPTYTPSVESYTLGYNLYKITVYKNISIATNALNFLGNSGLILLNIPDEFKLLHSLIRPLELEGLSLVGVTLFGEEKTIDYMTKYVGLTSMENNAIVIAPKDYASFTTLYKANIFIKKVIIYEKYSDTDQLNTKPYASYEEIDDAFITFYPLNKPPKPNRDAVKKINQEVEWQGTKFIFSNLERAPIILSVPFKSTLTGYIKGQIKTDIVSWVKQPYCSSVEIKYFWSATYDWHIIKPNGYCNVVQASKIYYRTDIQGSAPPCGDHTYYPPPSCHIDYWMWYPYVSCKDFAKYEQTSLAIQGGGDLGVMELWECTAEDYEDDETEPGQVPKKCYDHWEHNRFDMRMLGPEDNLGRVLFTHLSFNDCSCDYTFINGTRTSDAWFSGTARMVTHLEGENLYNMQQCSSENMPPFGDTYRDQLISFRSEGNFNYYYNQTIGDTIFSFLGDKWMPVPQNYALTSLDFAAEDYQYKKYFNEDNISSYINQLGILLGTNVDSHNLDEVFVEESLRYNDVFYDHHTIAGITYPQSVPEYNKKTLEGLKRVNGYVTYKPLNVASPNAALPHESIMHAWRQEWKSLEVIIEQDRTELFEESFLNDTLDELIYDYLPFLDINYPEYGYDYRLREGRRVPTEGLHTISFRIGVLENEEEQTKLYYYAFYLDEGPALLYDSDFNIVEDPSDVPDGIVFSDITNIEEDIHYYKLCSGIDWLNGVYTLSMPNNIAEYKAGRVLYEKKESKDSTEELEELARKERRTIGYFNNMGEEKEYFFNRGLAIHIKRDLLDTGIPKQVFVIDDYLVNLNLPTDDPESMFSSMDNLIDIPGSIPLDLLYKQASLLTSLTILITFKLPKLIEYLNLSFNYGKFTDALGFDKWFAIPNIRLYFGINGQDVEKEYIMQTFSEDTLDFTIKDFQLRHKLTFEEAKYGISYVKLVLSIDPIYIRNLNNYYEENNKSNYLGEFIHLIGFSLRESIYMDVDVKLNTYERLFKVSKGSCGNFPVQGTDIYRTLHRHPEEISTLVQVDTRYGISGAALVTKHKLKTISKFYSRSLSEIKDEFVIVEGDYLELENKQKELYDKTSQLISGIIVYDSCLKDVLGNFFKRVGVTRVPEWSFTLRNNDTGTLIPVEAKSLFYPGGHLWEWYVFPPYETIVCGEGTIEYRYVRANQSGEFYNTAGILTRYYNIFKNQYIVKDPDYFGADHYYIAHNKYEEEQPTEEEDEE